MRWLIVLAAALVFAGIASAGGPSSVTVTQGTWPGGDAASLAARDGTLAYAPTTVTVRRGTLLGGDIASLAAIDNNTLDLAAESILLGYRATIRVEFTAAIGHVHYGAWAEPAPVKCYFGLGMRRKFIGTTLTTGEGKAYPWVDNWTVPVDCRASFPFTVHIDRVTLD
jgi:hypothetical protein